MVFCFSKNKDKMIWYLSAQDNHSNQRKAQSSAFVWAKKNVTKWDRVALSVVQNPLMICHELCDIIQLWQSIILPYSIILTDKIILPFTSIFLSFCLVRHKCKLTSHSYGSRFGQSKNVQFIQLYIYYDYLFYLD